MKRCLAALLALLMLFALAACGEPPVPSAAPETPEPTEEPEIIVNTPEPTEPPLETEAPAPPEEPEDGDDPEDGEDPEAALPGTYALLCPADVYEFFTAMTAGMARIASRLEREHNDALSPEEYEDIAVLYYLPFSGLDFLDAMYFGEKTAPASVEAALRSMGHDDAEVSETAENEYTIRYGTSGGEFSEVIRCDLERPALSVAQYLDGALTGFTELCGLGDGQYAMVDLTNRALVTCDEDGTVIAFDHAENIYETNWRTGEVEPYSCANGPARDGVFDREEVGGDWLLAPERAGGLYRRYRYEGGVLRITGTEKEMHYGSDEPPAFVPGYELTLP